MTPDFRAPFSLGRLFILITKHDAPFCRKKRGRQNIHIAFASIFVYILALIRGNP